MISRLKVVALMSALIVLTADVRASGADPVGAKTASDAKRQARASMALGTTLFRRGDYQGALRAFTAAQEAYPSPKIFFNLGQTYRKLDRVPEAVAAFETFLADAPDAAPARRRDAEQYLAELKPRLPAPPPALPEAAAPAESAPPPPVAVPAPPPPPPPVATPPAPKPEPVIATVLAPPPEPPPPEHRRWPWVVAAVVVAGGVAAALLITRDGPLPSGSLGSYDGRTH